MSRPLTQPLPKKCVFCGVEFRRRAGERIRDYVNRVTCGPKCRVALVIKDRKQVVVEVPKRHCLWCDNILDGGKKSYCCRECVDNHQRSRADAQRELKRPKSPQWPASASFADQNIEAEPELGRIWLPPISISVTGSSAGYTADRGESGVENDIRAEPKPAKKGNHYVLSLRKNHHAL